MIALALLARTSTLVFLEDEEKRPVCTRRVQHAASVLARTTLLAASTVMGLRIGAYRDFQTTVGCCVEDGVLRRLTQIFK